MSAPHGYGRYSNGCKAGSDGRSCDDCRTAKREYMAQRRRDAKERRRAFEAANPGKTYVVYGIRHGGTAARKEHFCGCLTCNGGRRRKAGGSNGLQPRRDVRRGDAA